MKKFVGLMFFVAAAIVVAESGVSKFVSKPCYVKSSKPHVGVKYEQQINKDLNTL